MTMVAERTAPRLRNWKKWSIPPELVATCLEETPHALFIVINLLCSPFITKEALAVASLLARPVIDPVLGGSLGFARYTLADVQETFTETEDCSVTLVKKSAAMWRSKSRAMAT